MDVDEEEDDMATIRTADYSKMTKSFDVDTRAKSLDIDELMKEQSPESALSQLVRSWVAERGAPVVLEWQGEIVDEVMSQIEEQSKIVDSLKSDDRSTDEEHFQLILVQTEVERAKYVITSYVRARLSKVRCFLRECIYLIQSTDRGTRAIYRKEPLHAFEFIRN